MSALITPEDLAEDFSMTVEQLHRRRRARGWPFIRLGRFTIRFTPEQVEQIKRIETVTSEVEQKSAGTVDLVIERTPRSQGRKRTERGSVNLTGALVMVVLFALGPVIALLWLIERLSVPGVAA